MMEQKGARIHEGRLASDRVHMYVFILTKYSAAKLVGFAKGRGAVHIARTYGGKAGIFPVVIFWHEDL